MKVVRKIYEQSRPLLPLSEKQQQQKKKKL